jgi:hypothetical protein
MVCRLADPRCRRAIPLGDLLLQPTDRSAVNMQQTTCGHATANAAWQVGTCSHARSAAQGTDNAGTGTRNAGKGTDNAGTGTRNAGKGTDDVSACAWQNKVELNLAYLDSPSADVYQVYVQPPLAHSHTRGSARKRTRARKAHTHASSLIGPVHSCCASLMPITLAGVPLGAV